MTNFEFYKDKLLNITTESSVALINGEPVCCGSIDCEVCDLCDTRCCAEIVKWLYQEYEPYMDWSNVDVDTPVLVSDFENQWYRRYFAKYENGKVYTFRRGATSWSSDHHPIAWKYAKLKED